MKDQRGQHIEPNWSGFRCIDCGEMLPNCTCPDKYENEKEKGDE